MVEIIFVSTTKEDQYAKILVGARFISTTRSECKDCGGSQICEHNKRRSQCKDCGGSQICEHNRIKSQCLFCGRSQIYEHNKTRSQRKDCDGSQIFEHNNIKSGCKDCDHPGHLAGVLRHHIYTALKTIKK